SRRRLLVLGGGAIVLAACGGSGDRRLVASDDPSVARRERERLRPGAPTVSTTLTAAPMSFDLAGQTVSTWGFGAIPGEAIRARAGDVLEVVVRNDLPEDLSIHWHGIALRNDMDGVHDVTQPPIVPGSTFTYRFTVPDPGTYWFHPHTGLQLDRGLYAPLVVDDPAEPLVYDRDETLVFDDWLDGLGRTPEQALVEARQRMGSMSGMDGMAGMGSVTTGGGSASGMSMASTLLGGDAGDVSYPLHLVNGRPPADRPTISVSTGDRVRIRLINAGSDTAYRVAVGGHRMTVTHTDGFAVEPVEVDTLLLGMGERYDVVVTARSGAWPIVASAEGKSASASAVLRTSDASVSTAPSVDESPAELAGKLLTYGELKGSRAVALPDVMTDRDRDVALTGDMMAYDWGIDGRSFANHKPIDVRSGDRVRLVLRNKTAMWHPMHLHGHTFRVGGRLDGPRKDTVNVLPGEKVIIDFDADNPGQWMMHCHNTYHLESGMATVVSYVQ
ncbi:MAG: multicopper oxidase family protein, partial [Actinobacteria bacterium]|nr:multicopper oxidase family protein [Actinomycetota bacterium]